MMAAKTIVTESPVEVPTKWRVRKPWEKVVVPCDNNEPSKTWQAAKDECDVNLIIANYNRTGLLGHVNPKQPMYGDFSEALQLQEAIALVRGAESEFMQLPAHIRAMANNDPVTFLEMLADEGAVAALKAAGMPIQEPGKGDTPKEETAQPPAS